MSMESGTPRLHVRVAELDGERYEVVSDEEARQVTGARVWSVEFVDAQDIGPQLRFSVPVTNFKHGSGYTFEGIDVGGIDVDPAELVADTYDWGTGWDPSNYGELVTWPQFEAGQSFNSGTDYRGWVAFLGSSFYVMRGRWVMKYDVTQARGSVLPIKERHDLGASDICAGRPALFQGKLYVPRRAGVSGALAVFHELTTQRATSPAVVTVTIAGTPTGGTYKLTINGTDTSNLAFNAGGALVQAALRAIPGLESVTVATAGSTPNFTHTVTLTGVAAALTASVTPTLTKTDNTTGGTHSVTVGAAGASTLDTWTAGGAGAEARLFTGWQDKLVLANGNEIRTCSTTPTTAANWAPDTADPGYAVGESGSLITDMWSHLRFLMIGKTDGLWTFDENLNTTNELPDLASVVDASNCVGGGYWSGASMIPHKAGFIRFDPGSEYGYVGPEREGALSGNLSRGWGRVAGIAPYGKKVFYTVNDALHQSAALMSLEPPPERFRPPRWPLVPHMYQERHPATYEDVKVVSSQDEPVAPTGPTTFANDAAAGSIDWTNTANAETEDDTFASVTGSGAQGVATQSHYLKGTALGKSVPTTAVINGILVRVKVRAQ